MTAVQTEPDFANLGVTDRAQLQSLVAASLGVDHVDQFDLTITEVPYDIPALTTRGRYRIRGQARAGAHVHDVSIFVKVVQTWRHSPVFQEVPPDFREIALGLLPWEVEPAVYRSDLAAHLPPGLRMPTAYAVVDLDDEAAALWLEDVETSERDWDLVDHQRAAEALARFAARPSVLAALHPLRGKIPARPLHDYVSGRVTAQILPALRSEELWAHPLVATHFGALRSRLCTLADRLPALLDELLALPAGVCHGDACTRNLLIPPGDGDLVMIDFSFVRFSPLGLDLGQLVLGEIQLGERSADDLDALWRTCLAAYVVGVAAEGSPATPTQIARASAISMAIFAGVSAIPFELLGGDPNPQTERMFANRARVAEFVLELVGD